MKNYILLLVFLLCAQPVRADIVVDDAYVPEMPPSSMVSAAYLTMTNTGDDVVKVTAIAASGFKMARLHETTITDGVSSMKPLDYLRIMPGETVVLEPGGLHIMLMHPKEELMATGPERLKIQFDDGSSVDVVATVRTIN